MASSPRYGFTVTASAPRASNSAAACRSRGRADVAALRVGDERDVGRDEGPQPLERGDARRPERLEEREVGLHRGGAREGRLEQQPREALDAAERRGKAGGQRRRVRVDPEAQHGPYRGGPRRQPLEVRRRGHEPDGEAAGASVWAGDWPGGDEPAGTGHAVEASARRQVRGLLDASTQARCPRAARAGGRRPGPPRAGTRAGRRPATTRAPSCRRRWLPAAPRRRSRRRGSPRPCRCALVRVAARYFPSGDHDGLQVAGARDGPGLVGRGRVQEDARRPLRPVAVLADVGEAFPSGRHAGSWCPSGGTCRGPGSSVPFLRLRA